MLFTASVWLQQPGSTLVPGVFIKERTFNSFFSNSSSAVSCPIQETKSLLNNASWYYSYCVGGHLLDCIPFVRLSTDLHYSHKIASFTYILQYNNITHAVLNTFYIIRTSLIWYMQSLHKFNILKPCFTHIFLTHFTFVTCVLHT